MDDIVEGRRLVRNQPAGDRTVQSSAENSPDGSAPDGSAAATSAEATRRSRIASATFLQMVARIGGTAASLVTVSLTTRTLGPESFGHLQAAIMFIALWTSLTELGINAVIVRRVTGAESSGGVAVHGSRVSLPILVRTNIGLSSVFAVPLMLLAGVTGFAIYNTTPETAGAVLIIAGSLALTALANSFDPVFMVRVKFGAVAASDAVGRFASMFLTIALVASGAPLLWFAAVQLIPPAAQLVIKGFAARRVISIRPIYSWSRSWDLIRESLPQTAILIIGVLYWRIDGVILSLMSTPDQVGVFGLAYTLAFTASMVPELFMAASLSTSTELFARDREKFVRFTRRTLEILYLMALPLIAVGAVLAGGLMTLIGSAAFADGHMVLALLMLAAGFTFINAAVSQALFAAHQQVFLMRLNIINLLINIALNLVLAPRLGAEGAALSLVASELIGIVVANLRLRWMGMRVQPFGFVAHTMPAVLLAAGLAWVLADTSVILAGGAACLGYVATQLLIGPARISYIRATLSRQTGKPERVAAPGLARPAGGEGQ